MPGAGNPQAFNRYSYAANNPINFNDPTGHDWKCTGANNDHCYDDGKGKISGMVDPRSRGGGGKPIGNASDFGLVFAHNRTDAGLARDIQSFSIAVSQEANKMYDVYCQACEFSSPAELYVATHGTTVITFSNTSVDNYYCERNANPGQEGVSCYANSRGDIDPILAAHEMAHVFNALISNNGYTTPYTDMANERVNNWAFPALNVAITDGYIRDRATDGTPGEDYANMYSMWVFDDWPDPTIDTQRREFMTNNMYNWILRLLNR